MVIVNKLREVSKIAIKRECVALVGHERFYNDRVEYYYEIVPRWPLICDLLISGKPIPKQLMI